MNEMNSRIVDRHNEYTGKAQNISIDANILLNKVSRALDETNAITNSISGNIFINLSCLIIK